MNKFSQALNASSLTAAFSLIAALALVAGCWNPFSPDTQQGEEVQYYSPVDSAWKVLKNLEYAYISLDIDHYLDCFRSDFEFHLLEVDWFDYDGDGTIDEYWGLDSEEEFHISMFDNVAAIELTLSGTTEYPWDDREALRGALQGNPVLTLPTGGLQEGNINPRIPPYDKD